MLKIGGKSGIFIWAHKLNKCKRKTPVKFTCVIKSAILNDELASIYQEKKEKNRKQKPALNKQKVAVIKSELCTYCSAFFHNLSC